MKYFWVRLLSRSSFFSNMRWEVDKTSRYFIITSDSSELTSTMSGRASASGVKHLQKEHSLMKANYFFLKNRLVAQYSSIGIYQVMLASTLLKPAWDSLTLCSLGVDTPQSRVSGISWNNYPWHFRGTNPDRTIMGGCCRALPDALGSAWWLFLGPGETLASPVGTVLWSMCCTTGQCSCEGDECAVRRIYRRMTRSSQRLCRDKTPKQCKEGEKPRDYT